MPSVEFTSDRSRRGWRSRSLPLFAILSALLFLAGCANSPERPPRTEANDVLFSALGLVGTPYHWGGNTPDSGFDCSGLVRYVYDTTLDIALPRTSRAMSKIDSPRIKLDQLDSGDLVFFHGRSSRISHVGIYVGKGRFVHAPNSGGTVRLDRLDNSYWSSHFSFARRPLQSR